ncbi:MAG TPA: M20 family metallopeptidase [Candidatus Tripitaka californicus]|uniref:M20 family metallopeptidase n=1 Tax=Candidatus Tripitaka californicus TaxID=3367616 RepID=UPI00402735EF|nr:ArgE/DapE family deacylase [Planctomycetota bacterium]
MAGTLKREAKRFAQAHWDELVELTCQLIRARTENPPGKESLAARVVQTYLKSLDIPYTLHEKEPERTNIVARVGHPQTKVQEFKGSKVQAAGPSLLVACHLDVVPAGDGWETDPFEPLVKNGRVYGRGATDNKGQMAACMILARFLKEHEPQLQGEFVLIGAADEERGSRLGLEYLLEECGLTADYAVIPDVSYGMKKIDVAEKGALFLEVTSYGRQAHGSRPEEGINAIWNMMDLLQELKTLSFTCTNHPLFTPPTLNLGTIQGGAARNIVPGKCQVGIDIRHLPGESKEGILERVRGIIKRVEEKNPQAHFELKIDSYLEPSSVDADNPLVGLLKRHTESVMGLSPELTGLSGATVTKQLLQKGITAVGFGPGSEKEAHVANESIDIQQLADFVEIMALVCMELLGKRP